MEDLKFYQDKMDKTMEVLLADYGTIRAGRANPHVLDKIKVDYYGTPTPEKRDSHGGRQLYLSRK